MSIRQKITFGRSAFLSAPSSSEQSEHHLFDPTVVERPIAQGFFGAGASKNTAPAFARCTRNSAISGLMKKGRRLLAASIMARTSVR